VAVEVTASHGGLAFDPRVIAEVLAALERHERAGVPDAEESEPA
jgi:hypothetical protein